MATPILRIPSKPKVSIDWDIDPVAVNDDEMPPEKRIKLLDLEPHHCRWGIGDPKKDDFGFCGAQKVPGLSYCMEHARRAYRPPEAPCRSKKSDAAETPEAVDA